MRKFCSQSAVNLHHKGKQKKIVDCWFVECGLAIWLNRLIEFESDVANWLIQNLR